MIGRRFEVARERLGFNKRTLRLETRHLAPPARKGAAAAENSSSLF